MDSAAGKSEALAEEEGRVVHKLLQVCLKVLHDEPSGASDGLDIRSFHRSLVAAADPLEGSLKSELEALGDLVETEELGSSLVQWFDKLREQCWQPLTGPMR